MIDSYILLVSSIFLSQFILSIQKLFIIKIQLSVFNQNFELYCDHSHFTLKHCTNSDWSYICSSTIYVIFPIDSKLLNNVCHINIITKELSLEAFILFFKHTLCINKGDMLVSIVCVVSLYILQFLYVWVIYGCGSVIPRGSYKSKGVIPSNVSPFSFLLVRPPMSQSLLIMGWCSSIPEHRLRLHLDSGPYLG